MTEDCDEIRELEEQETISDEAEPGLEQQLEAARQEIEQLKDKYLRSVAELENYRKRIAREREQQQLRLRMELIRQLLPVADDFALAVSHVPEEYSATPWIEGITLILRKLESYLSGQGVVAIDATGQPFDPYYHDALMREASEEHPEGVVTEEVRKGYMMGDEVLRPTLVKVSVGPAEG